MKLKTVSLVLSLVLCASPALAVTVIDTYPSWTGFTTSGWEATAQTFTAPTDNVLSNYKFGIAGRSVDGTLDFSIFAWSGVGQVGPALYSVTTPWTTAGGDILISGINLALTTGSLYGAVIDLGSYGGSSVHYESDAYSGGHGFWGYDGVTWTEFSGLDHQFRAEFGADAVVPEPGTVLLLGSGLAGLAARFGWAHHRLRRRSGQAWRRKQLVAGK